MPGQGNFGSSPLSEVEMPIASESTPGFVSNTICNFCSKFVASEQSGMFNHHSELARLENSAATCAMCRILLRSLEGCDGLGILLHRIYQREKLGDTNFSSDRIENLSFYFEPPFWRLTIECKSPDRTLCGEKLAFCNSQGLLFQHQSVV